MRALSFKLAARKLAADHGVPVTPGSGAVDPTTALDAAREIGFPVMLKPSGGGGGIGMKVVESEKELAAAIESTSQAASSAFGDGTVYLERYVRRPRHVEIQVICDSHGNAVHLGERECSIQRRHQKIMGEAPAPAVSREIRSDVGEAALRAARAAGYVNAGTVEFIFSEGEFYFLEVNARLQVEHPITEAVTGIDLVKEQIRVAAGLPLSFSQQEVSWNGHAIEMRINAEDPARKFMPNPKRIARWVAPAGPGVRVDSGFGPGSDVPPNYDSLIAKLIVHGADRAPGRSRWRARRPRGGPDLACSGRPSFGFRMGRKRRIRSPETRTQHLSSPTPITPTRSSCAGGGAFGTNHRGGCPPARSTQA